jgi:pimeloyl-ACP methyl ester carboxylesterase
VLAWIHQRHSQKPYLFGWSYGSMVSQLVAQRSPDLVSGIILFGYPVREGSAITPPGSAGDPPRRATTASAAAEDFIVDGAISERAIAAFVAQALAADPVRADWRALEQWQALDAAAVTVPVLLMEGESDPLAVDSVQAELFNNLATTDKMWVVIPEGDHAAFLETPRDYFLSILQSFILRR